MPKAKFLVRGDFNKDGDFDDANEDVTADVLQFSVTRGKNLPKHRAEAAVLDMLLRNDTHKYTPTNTGSPLYPNVLPAPYIWVMAGYPVDDFNANDATLLTGRKPSHDDKFAAWANDTGDFWVSGNALIPKNTGNKVASLVLGAASVNETSYWVGGWFTRGGGTSGLTCRLSDASNFLIVYPDGTNIILGKVEAGALSTIASAAHTWVLSAKKFVQIELHGDAIRVLVNNVLVLTGSTTFNNTAERAGVGGWPTSVADEWDDFGGWRSLFYGRIDSIEPEPAPEKKWCYIRAFDDFERLGRYMVWRTAPAAPATAAAILGEILDAANFSTANRVIDTGATLTQDTNSRKALGRDALTELMQVQDDDVGFAYLDGNGIFHYEASGHRAAAPHTVHAAVWRFNRFANTDEDRYFSDLHWDDGKDRVENEGYFWYHKLSVASVVEVWRLQTDDKPAIAAGATLKFLALGDGDAIANTLDPPLVAGTDYSVNTLEGGGGTDLTGSVAVSLESGFEGNTRMVVLTNNSGSAGFVTLLRLRAARMTQSVKTAARAEDTASQTSIGRRRVEHQALHIDRFTRALDRVGARITQRKDPKARLVLTMPNGTRENLKQILHRSMSDRIAIYYPFGGLSGYFFIERQSIKVTEGGLLVECTWELQAV